MHVQGGKGGIVSAFFQFLEVDSFTKNGVGDVSEIGGFATGNFNHIKSVFVADHTVTIVRNI